MNGNPYNGEINPYFVPASDAVALFIGDPVTLAGAADASGKYPTVKQAVAGTTNLIAGVVMGFGLTPEIAAMVNSLEKRYRLANEDMYVFVADDMDLIFEIQEVSGGTALTAAQIGNNAPIVVGSGNVDTGLSGVELNNVGETAATEQIRILRLAPGLDNELGEHAKWWVFINEHAFNQELGV
ncbi:MAG: hypothetical protein JRJ27_00065 [Deltaproteobacteria bacterium]|nr:hypothetical protein [Deltaproteobacteria bacterium]